MEGEKRMNDFVYLFPFVASVGVLIHQKALSNGSGLIISILGILIVSTKSIGWW